MVLYAESLLIMLYSIYLKHQTKTGLDVLQLEDFRLMFEEQQEVIAKILEKEITETTDEIETEKEIWH
ncbi:hypothetical protein [uncultured virus]|uniref:Uncharacterized protein n=1 Tax=uncultured virus TaxID=340016 RepID=A0A218MM27_9VIRU|nr:hypothetical protein [uncultured virus]ASF00343.1 hypothetical protein [uncultured virus]